MKQGIKTVSLTISSNVDMLDITDDMWVEIDSILLDNLENLQERLLENKGAYFIEKKTATAKYTLLVGKEGQVTLLGVDWIDERKV